MLFCKSENRFVWTLPHPVAGMRCHDWWDVSNISLIITRLHRATMWNVGSKTYINYFHRDQPR